MEPGETRSVSQPPSAVLNQTLAPRERSLTPSCPEYTNRRAQMKTRLCGPRLWIAPAIFSGRLRTAVPEDRMQRKGTTYLSLGIETTGAGSDTAVMPLL